MIILKRKQQEEILSKLLVLRKLLPLIPNDTERGKRYVEAFNAIVDVADIVTGLDIEMFTGFARDVYMMMYEDRDTGYYGEWEGRSRCE